jgi:signal transduction histidine kinase
MWGPAEGQSRRGGLLGVRIARLRREPLEGLTIKAALVLGFGLTLGLWLFSGYYFTRRIADVQLQSSAINARYMQAQELLSTVRTQILMASVYVRDALLDPNPSVTPDYRDQLEAIYQGIERDLNHYVPVLDSDLERQRVDQLRRGIEQFRSTMAEVLASDSTQWPRDARLLLRSRIVPRRDDVIRVSDEVQALNRSAFVRQQTAIGQVYEETQRSVWTQLGLALAASFVIGLFATRYVGRLEARLLQQLEKDVANTRDLKRLSSQIITAQEEERRNIARELHDEVGQVLTAVKVELAVAQRAVDGSGAPRDLLAGARALTDNALQTVRDLSRLLHPTVLDDLGLRAAVDAHLREISKRHGLVVDLVHDRTDERLEPKIEAAAYRIIQEAVTNVVRHAYASTCRVVLQRELQSLLITIEDDGVGFDADGERAGRGRAGLGLLGIRERVAQVRGTVRLESAPGKGTRLTIELPARPRAVAEPAGVEAEPSGSEAVHG